MDPLFEMVTGGTAPQVRVLGLHAVRRSGSNGRDTYSFFLFSLPCPTSTLAALHSSFRRALHLPRALLP